MEPRPIRLPGQRETTSELIEVRKQIELVETKAELVALTQAVESIGTDTPSRIVAVEAFGDHVARDEYLHDDPHWFESQSEFSRPEDRKHGDNYPFWQSEVELAQIRGVCSNLCEVDEIGSSALENLTNYVLGKRGFEYVAEAKFPRVDNELATAVQSALDEYIEDSNWDTVLERESFKRAHREGESLLTIEPIGGGRAWSDIIEPSHLTEPDAPRDLEDFYGLGALNWKYGIAKMENNPRRRLGYFVERFANQQDWSYYTTKQMTHIKNNVDDVIARGMPDLYPAFKDLKRAEKLLRNTAEGAAVQACIAYIKEGAQGVRAADLEANKGGSNALHWLESKQRGKGGPKEVTTRRFLPATVLNVKAGTKYHAGPLGSSNANTYIDIVQALMRRAGIRWQMPEYMISGDASNGNFASTLVAEAPFTKSSEHRQSRFQNYYRSHMWKVVDVALAAGVFDKFGVRSLRELKKRISIEVEGDDIAVRDKLEEHTIRREMHAAGILSSKTWAKEVGIDHEEETEKGATPIGFADALPDGWVRRMPEKLATTDSDEVPSPADKTEDGTEESSESVDRLAVASRSWENYP